MADEREQGAILARRTQPCRSPADTPGMYRPLTLLLLGELFIARRLLMARWVEMLEQWPRRRERARA